LRSLELADRLVVLHALAPHDLPRHVRHKARVVIQSAVPAPKPVAGGRTTFDFCILGHLRHVKDPLRPALALRLLRKQDRFRLYQAGQSLEERYARLARKAMDKDGRYRWLGEVSRARAQALLARSDVMIISSRLEGGANVISEAVVNEVPILASLMPGNVGLLGEDYPAYYPVGDTRALADLMRRVGDEPAFYGKLKKYVRDLKPRFRPEQERESWRRLLNELVPT
jgi:glycosyltransferase involved in cell wall biosynthesis